MTLVLDATIGGAAANTYATLAEATTLADSLFPAPDPWVLASESDKNRALVHACRELDQERFAGDRYTVEQALEWPRARVQRPGGTGNLYGIGGVTSYLVTEVPEPVKRAQIVRAMYLVDQASRNDGRLVSDDTAGLSALSLGGEIGLTLDPSAASQTDRDRHFATVIRPILGMLVFAPQLRMVR